MLLRRVGVAPRGLGCRLLNYLHPLVHVLVFPAQLFMLGVCRLGKSPVEHCTCCGVVEFDSQTHYMACGILCGWKQERCGIAALPSGPEMHSWLLMRIGIPGLSADVRLRLMSRTCANVGAGARCHFGPSHFGSSLGRRSGRLGRLRSHFGLEVCSGPRCAPDGRVATRRRTEHRHSSAGGDSVLWGGRFTNWTPRRHEVKICEKHCLSDEYAAAPMDRQDDR